MAFQISKWTEMCDQKPRSIWFEFEKLAVRLGIIGFLLSISLFAITIGIGLLVVDAGLSTYLQIFNWGVTLLTIIIGTLLAKIAYEIMQIIRQVGRAIELFIKIPLYDVLKKPNTIGSLLTYYVFELFGAGVYYGLYDWAFKVVKSGNYSAKVFIPESPIVTVALVTLDWASALAALATLGFTFAIVARFYSLLSSRLPFVQSLFGTISPANFSILDMFPEETDPDSDPEKVNYDVLLDFTSRITVGSILLGGLALQLGHFLQRQTFTPWGLGPKAFLGFTVLLLAIISFVYGFLTEITEVQSTVTSIQRQTANMVLMRTQWLWPRVLIGLVWLVAACLVYLGGIGELPSSRASTPPIQLMSFSNWSQFHPNDLLYPVLQPVNYFEFARIAGVTGILAGSVPLGYHGKKWWTQSQLSSFPDLIRTVIAGLKWPIETFIAKMTNLDDISKWTTWVRGGVFIQMLGVASLLQTFPRDQSVEGAMTILVFGMIVQFGFAVLETRGRYHSGERRRWAWPLVILIFPFIGGIAYVFIEY